jgi:hypothetical protein
VAPSPRLAVELPTSGPSNRPRTGPWSACHSRPPVCSVRTRPSWTPAGWPSPRRASGRWRCGRRLSGRCGRSRPGGASSARPRRACGYGCGSRRAKSRPTLPPRPNGSGTPGAYTPCTSPTSSPVWSNCGSSASTSCARSACPARLPAASSRSRWRCGRTPRRSYGTTARYPTNSLSAPPSRASPCTCAT